METVMCTLELPLTGKKDNFHMFRYSKDFLIVPGKNKRNMNISVL